MKFKEGQILNIENTSHCLLKIIEYNGRVYGFFAAEADKLIYLFYEIRDNGNGYELFKVIDENLNCILLSIFEEMESND